MVGVYVQEIGYLQAIIQLHLALGFVVIGLILFYEQYLFLQGMLLLLFEDVLLLIIAIVLYLEEYFKLFLNITGGLITINTLSMLLISG